MKASLIVVAIFAGFSCLGAEATWNSAAAIKEAEQDIRSGHIKFYWSGSIASMPVGAPIELAKKYPKENAGVGCVITDIELRKRQEDYARRYNQRILAYLDQKRKNP